MLTADMQFKEMITAVTADLSTQRARFLRKTLQHFPEEAVYVYSFAQKKMIYADGWEEVLGYRDDEISLQTIVNSTTPEFKPFASELNKKALLFIMSRTTDLEKYSLTMEVMKTHKNGGHIPLIVRVGVFASQNGKVMEIIGRSQINRSIIFGKVMQYVVYGLEKAAFVEQLNKQLFRYHVISQKEKEALVLVASGYSFKEIANQFQVTPSAIEKRIIPLYKRFNVKSLTHLVSFAYDNHILNR